MQRSLLLDADVVIDLHALGLFGKISRAYDICLTQDVFVVVALHSSFYERSNPVKNPFHAGNKRDEKILNKECHNWYGWALRGL